MNQKLADACANTVQEFAVLRQRLAIAEAKCYVVDAFMLALRAAPGTAQTLPPSTVPELVKQVNEANKPAPPPAADAAPAAEKPAA